MGDALAAVREAFAMADRGGAVMPTPFELHLPDIDGELHVKGAYLKGAPVFAVKTALQAGIFDAGSVYGELAAVASGRLAGRTAEDELTVADLTGLGIQDAAVAALTARLAGEHRAGRDVALGES